MGIRTSTKRIVSGGRAAALAFAVAAFGILPGAAAAAEFPEDTLRIIVPWRAGGGTDTIARAFAASMEELVDQAVVVENLTAGTGTAGMMAVKKAEPDGHTMLLTGSSDLNTPIIFRSTPYALDDYACAGAFYNTPTWALAHKDQGLVTLGDFIDRAKAQPGELTIGVGSLASAHYVMAAAIVGNNGIDVRIIPFDGGGPLKKALIGNQVTMGVIHSPVLLNEVKDGLIVPLAAGGDMANINHPPVRDLPHIETYNTPIEVGTIRGIYLPKTTPDETRAEVEALVKRAAENDAFRAFGESFGFAPVWMSGEQYCGHLRSEQAQFRDIKAKFIDN